MSHPAHYPPTSGAGRRSASSPISFAATPPAYSPRHGETPPPTKAPAGRTSAKRRRLWLFILVGVLVVALALGGFVLWWYEFRDDGQPGHARSPQSAVRGYLQALAAGDAAAALAYALTPPANATMLTDAVLKASLALGPITNIVVQDHAAGTPADTVTASYRIGSRPVTASFVTVKPGKYYLLQQVTCRADLTRLRIDSLATSVNGVALTDVKSLGAVDLFPGSYQVGLANSLLTMTPTSFVVDQPVTTLSLGDVVVTLTPDAQYRFGAAAKAALEACMAEHALRTSCGFGKPQQPAGTKAIDSTIKWTFAGGNSNDLLAATYTYDPADSPTSVKAFVNITLKVDLNAKNGNHYSGTSYVFGATVDFADPRNLVVSFVTIG